MVICVIIASSIAGRGPGHGARDRTRILSQSDRVKSNKNNRDGKGVCSSAGRTLGLGNQIHYIFLTHRE